MGKIAIDLNCEILDVEQALSELGLRPKDKVDDRILAYWNFGLPIKRIAERLRIRESFVYKVVSESNE